MKNNLTTSDDKSIFKHKSKDELMKDIVRLADDIKNHTPQPSFIIVRNEFTLQFIREYYETV